MFSDDREWLATSEVVKEELIVDRIQPAVQSSLQSKLIIEWWQTDILWSMKKESVAHLSKTLKKKNSILHGSGEKGVITEPWNSAESQHAGGSALRPGFERHILIF